MAVEAVIADKLLATWSPEQIAHTVTLGQISFKTIYNWLYADELSTVEVKQLRQKGMRRKSEKRGKLSMGIPISKRSKEVKNRNVFGYWELDSMVSRRAFNVPLYFADAYCSWQRGSNTNSNGLLREFYPKKTKLTPINRQELTKNLLLINSRPCKCLG